MPLWDVLAVALAKAPEARFGSAQEMADRLAEACRPAKDAELARLTLDALPGPACASSTAWTGRRRPEGPAGRWPTGARRRTCALRPAGPRAEARASPDMNAPASLAGSGGCYGSTSQARGAATVRGPRGYGVTPAQ